MNLFAGGGLGGGGGVGFFDQIGCLRAPTVDSTEVARTWALDLFDFTQNIKKSGFLCRTSSF